MNLKEAISKMLKDCGAESTGEGLLADAKLLAKQCGIRFITLRETVDTLAPQFGLSIDEKEEQITDQGDFWDRIVDANTAASAFGDDDGLARQFASADSIPPFPPLNALQAPQDNFDALDSQLR
uniref:Uncharacterized protein n=1 Tax=Aureoumbra lagunensis TaxID=44058 RepID=A0A6S8D2T4_9STRA|mmetsp:Transcript_15538/g.20551  ORF Transcript_15538/g.20551 Transcript_15538/m.20551 type:complete len:124 (+) Transcript_15538:88-459(+)